MAPGLGHSPAPTQLPGLFLLAAHRLPDSPAQPLLFVWLRRPHPTPPQHTPSLSGSSGSSLWFHCRHVEAGAGGALIPWVSLLPRGKEYVRPQPSALLSHSFLCLLPVLHPWVSGTGSDSGTGQKTRQTWNLLCPGLWSVWEATIKHLKGGKAVASCAR